MNPAPTLETLAALYKAAWLQHHQAKFALDRIRDSITRHGFTETEVRHAAGIYITGGIDASLAKAGVCEPSA